VNVDVAASDRLDDTLLALADPTRRAILQRLARAPDGEARVTEIAAPFAISLNSVSKHIRILERARLLRRRTAGRDHFLSFEPRPLDEAAAWMEAQRARWTARLDALDALLRAEDAAVARPASRVRSRRGAPRVRRKGKNR
jgi:DNA-binding transcriptional ArsR family regulator